MEKKKVIVAGHACLDITPVFPSDTVCSTPGEMLSPGKLIQMDGVDVNAGGAVSNTGLAMKLLGADVRLMAKTGTDAFGTILSNIYASYGVCDGILAAEGERTSYSAVIAIPGVDRIFLHDPGCNNTFSLEDVKKADFSEVGLFHFGYPPLMKRMYEQDGSELVGIFRYVKEQGVATSLDLAFVDEGSDAGRADWRRILRCVLPYVDFFVPSVEELCWMLDPKRFETWKQRAGERELVSVLGPQEDVAPLAEECIRLGAKVLLLKCGAPGLYYQTGGKQRLSELSGILGLDADDWADRKGFEVSYKPGRVRSGTGAGDTTIAAFLVAMLSGYSFSQCVQLAAAEGASCVEDYGALGGIRPLAELEQKIRAGWEKRKTRAKNGEFRF